MLYKTITLALIRENRELHEHGCAWERTLLSTLNTLGRSVGRAATKPWIEIIARKRPGSGSSQIASDATGDRQIQELQERLRSDSLPSADERSLDAAMAYLHRHTPSA